MQNGKMSRCELWRRALNGIPSGRQAERAGLGHAFAHEARCAGRIRPGAGRTTRQRRFGNVDGNLAWCYSAG